MTNGSGPSSEDITRDIHTSIEVEGLLLGTSMRKKREKLPLGISMRKKIEKLPLLSRNCCIYRVPKRLRQVNEKAYIPLLVSIGPLHHGKKGLEAMEEHKRRYLRDFLEHSKKSIEEFFEFIREREGKIRECYAETVSHDSDKFVEIVLVDAAFIIEMFLRRYGSNDLISDDDLICGKPWMFRDIKFDLLLLENQIPFFVLEDLFVMADIMETPTTFMELTRGFIVDIVGLTNIGPEQENECSEVKHLIDFLRSCLIPWELMLSQQVATETEFESIRNATELKEAGVKFKASSSENLFDIKFSGGVLEVPRIRITVDEERYLRNLVAFEQCHCGSGYMGDYVSIMDNLIDTSKDVELLVRSGVIENWLADSQDVSNLFNKLSDGISLDSDNFHFTQVCKKINEHCKNPRNKCMATLRHDYCNTPWKILSVVVAAIFLLLTFIQTVCSINEC